MVSLWRVTEYHALEQVPYGVNNMVYMHVKSSRKNFVSCSLRIHLHVYINSRKATDPNIFRILLTNDNHIGFKEDDPVRTRDALVTFEEIVQIAKTKNVDFVLHSGDLFDDCRPNRYWVTSVMRLLQKHCHGDREVLLQHLRTEYSEPANFEDPNRNIDLPIYMIHGIMMIPVASTVIASRSLSQTC